MVFRLMYGMVFFTVAMTLQGSDRFIPLSDKSLELDLTRSVTSPGSSAHGVAGSNRFYIVGMKTNRFCDDYTNDFIGSQEVLLVKDQNGHWTLPWIQKKKPLELFNSEVSVRVSQTALEKFELSKYYSGVFDPCPRHLCATELNNDYVRVELPRVSAEHLSECGLQCLWVPARCFVEKMSFERTRAEGINPNISARLQKIMGSLFVQRSPTLRDLGISVHPALPAPKKKDDGKMKLLTAQLG